jgi:hypothetical protein
VAFVTWREDRPFYACSVGSFPMGLAVTNKALFNWSDIERAMRSARTARASYIADHAKEVGTAARWGGLSALLAFALGSFAGQSAKASAGTDRPSATFSRYY